MCTFVCSSGSQIKFDTRENIMESGFFFLQFLRKPEKWHNSSYHTTTGDYIVIICCLYPDGRRIFDRTAETTYVSCSQSQIFGTGCFGK